MINENILDPIHKELCSDIFLKEIMKGKVKSYILDTIYKWLQKMGYDERKVVKSIYLIGSSSGYQYTDGSDMDVSIEVDIPNDTVKKIWSLLPNGNNLPNTKHPVNYYLTINKDDVDRSKSAYDILNDTWLKRENKDDEKKQIIPMGYAMEVAKFFFIGAENRINEYERDAQELEWLKKLNPEEHEITQQEIDEKVVLKETELRSDLDAIHVAYNIIKSFRKEAFDKKETDLLLDIKINNPNNSINNVLYKLCENTGLLDKLHYYEVERQKLIDKN